MLYILNAAFIFPGLSELAYQHDQGLMMSCGVTDLGCHYILTESLGGILDSPCPSEDTLFSVT